MKPKRCQSPYRHQVEAIGGNQNRNVLKREPIMIDGNGMKLKRSLKAPKTAQEPFNCQMKGKVRHYQRKEPERPKMEFFEGILKNRKEADPEDTADRMPPPATSKTKT